MKVWISRNNYNPEYITIIRFFEKNLKVDIPSAFINLLVFEDLFGYLPEIGSCEVKELVLK